MNVFKRVSRRLSRGSNSNVHCKAKSVLSRSSHVEPMYEEDEVSDGLQCFEHLINLTLLRQGRSPDLVEQGGNWLKLGETSECVACEFQIPKRLMQVQILLSRRYRT